MWFVLPFPPEEVAYAPEFPPSELLQLMQVELEASPDGVRPVQYGRLVAGNTPPVKKPTLWLPFHSAVQLSEMSTPPGPRTGAVAENVAPPEPGVMGCE